VQVSGVQVQPVIAETAQPERWVSSFLLAAWVLAAVALPLLAWLYYTHGFDSYSHHVLHRHYRLVESGEFGLHVVLPTVFCELALLAGVGNAACQLWRAFRSAEAEDRLQHWRVGLYILGYFALMVGLAALLFTGCECRG